MRPHKYSCMLTTACITALLTLASGNLLAVQITGNLGGLLTPTGPATNTNKDRQYTWTTSGGQVTLTYTLSTSNGNLSNAFSADALFRYAPGTNVNSGQSITITIDSIVANPGWTLNSVSMADKATVAMVV